MRILQVVPVFSEAFGGPVTMVRSISKQLAAKGHEVVVFTTTALDRERDSSPREEEVDRYRVVYFPRTLKFLNYSYLLGSLNLSLGMMMGARTKLRNFDIIHLHSFQQFPDIIVHRYAMKYGVPYILQAHGSVPVIGKRLRRLLFNVFFGRKMLREASKVVAVSRMEASQYESVGVPKGKIEIVPNGIDLSQYALLPARGFFKKKFGISRDKKMILYLGRIHAIKGIDTLVKAYNYMIKKMERHDSVLAIVGPDDGYLGGLRTLARSLGIETELLIVGPIYGREKLEAYVDADLCVMPSRYEIWGMTVLEAYACGKPVVVSRVGGLRDLVSNGVTGLLVEPGDVMKLAFAICRLLDSPSEAEEMGLRGNQFLKENFTIGKVARKLEDLYVEIVSNQLFGT